MKKRSSYMILAVVMALVIGGGAIAVASANWNGAKNADGSVGMADDITLTQITGEKLNVDGLAEYDAEAPEGLENLRIVSQQYSLSTGNDFNAETQTLSIYFKNCDTGTAKLYYQVTETQLSDPPSDLSGWILLKDGAAIVEDSAEEGTFWINYVLGEAGETGEKLTFDIELTLTAKEVVS